MEVVAEWENRPVDPVNYYKAWDWAGVAPGTHFYKYFAPLEHLNRSKVAVEAKRQKMLNPEFARKLRRDIEGYKQCIRNWQRDMNWADEDADRLWYYNSTQKPSITLMSTKITC